MHKFWLFCICTLLLPQLQNLKEVKNVPTCILHLTRRTSTDTCVGIYVASYWVLTSQSCVFSMERDGRVLEIIICTGPAKTSIEYCEQRMLGVRITKHPKLNIALIESDYDFDHRLFPITPFIRTEEELAATTQDEQKCFVYGFEASETVASLELEYKINKYLGPCDDDHHVCVLNLPEMPCQSDSGSPLICDGKLVGILHKATPCNETQSGGGADGGNIDSYTKVVDLLNFIQYAQIVKGILWTFPVGQSHASVRLMSNTMLSLLVVIKSLWNV